MSEIKGQLLGIIIVLMVFGAVGGAMVAIFSNFAHSVEGNVTSVVKEGISEAEAYEYTSYNNLPSDDPNNG